MLHRLFIGALGSLLVANSSCDQDVETGCGTQGIIQKEFGGRYQLDFQAAADLCQSLGTTLATLDQLKRAHAEGYETCRYGWIEGGLIALPRIQAHPSCGKKFTGIYTVQRPQEMKYDVFCFRETDDRICSTSMTPPHPSLSHNHDLPTPSWMATGVHDSTELTVDPSTEDVGFSTDTSTEAERLPSSLVPRLVEQRSPSSAQRQPQSTRELSPLVVLTELFLSGEQPFRAAPTVTLGFNAEVSASPTRTGPVLNNYHGSPGLQIANEAMDGSGFARGRESYTESTRPIPLRSEDHDPDHPTEYSAEFPSSGGNSVSFPSTLFLYNDPLVNSASGEELQVHPVGEVPLTIDIHGAKSKGNLGITTIRSTPSPFRLTSDGSLIFNAVEGVREPHSEPHESSIFSIDIGSTDPPFHPTAFMDNSLRYYTTAYKPKDKSNSLDLNPILEESQVPEATEDPMTLGIHQDGLHSIPMTPNPTEMLEKMSSSSEVFALEFLLRQRAVGTRSRTEQFPSSPTPTDLTVDSGSTLEGSAPVDLPLDLSTVPVLPATWLPSKSPSPELRGSPVGSGSTPEAFDVEPTVVPLDFSTEQGNELVISVSPEPTALFVESGSTPDGWGSEPQDTVMGFTSEFTASTELMTAPTGYLPFTDSKRDLELLGRSTLQTREPDWTLPETTPGHSPTAAMPFVSTPEPVTSALPLSSAAPSVGLSPTAQSEHKVTHPDTTPSLTMVQSKLTTPGLRDATRSNTAPDLGSTVSPLSTTSRLHQMSPFTVGKQQKAQPNFTKAPDHNRLEEKLWNQPATTAVGEKSSAVTLDWLIVTAIIVALLIILIGGVVIIYSKRLCGRKKSLMITTQGEDGATAMEKGTSNGRGGDASKQGELNDGAKRSDEWIQLIDKDNMEVVPEAAEATKLMRRDESGVEVTATTQEQSHKS
ncbi:mucin-2-like [Leucoraja erinacea]|uniref:mucin-2-like n=1 Tax=Leucoraja erinaceus TaxID=7782 RepID=UPI002455AC14|nr:mucin-2-like [Leucoraja erinacea]